MKATEHVIELEALCSELIQAWPARERIAHQTPHSELKPLPERRTVLIVDDDPFMLDVIATILRDENYTLHTANTVDDAIRVANAVGAFDLLVTDYMMPGLTGSELASELRKTRPQLVVLYETGFSDKLFRSIRELEPFSAFIEKPFTARGLREATRLVLFGTINPVVSARQ